MSAGARARRSARRAGPAPGARRAALAAGCALGLAIGWRAALPWAAAVVRPVAAVVAPSVSGLAWFVLPGQAVRAPSPGQLAFLAPPGRVARGATLAVLVRRGPSRRPAWWCLGRACPRQAVAAAGRSEAVRAPAPGWFTPGADPLAELSAAADADLPPGAGMAPWPRPGPGTPLVPGVPLGVLGARWVGLWLLPVPELAADAVLAAGVPLPGTAEAPGLPPWPVTLLAAGPPVGGRRLLVLAADRGPAVPGAAVALRVRFPPVRGVLVPVAALRWPGPGGRLEGVAWSPWAPGRAADAWLAAWLPGGPRWVAVRVRALAGAEALVQGVPGDARGLLARPAGWPPAGAPGR
jgi:hypothetical protein